MRELHARDKSVLYALASPDSTGDVSAYVSGSADGLRTVLRIDEGLYIEKNTSTNAKLTSSVVCSRCTAWTRTSWYSICTTRKRQAAARAACVKSAAHTGLTPCRSSRCRTSTAARSAACNPGVSNTITGYFGVAGLSVRCIANYDAARAEFVISLPDLGENQAIFDRLLAHRQEIESGVGAALSWERAGDRKASVISCTMDGVSVTNESDWPAMAKFHAEWSKRLCSALLRIW